MEYQPWQAIPERMAALGLSDEDGMRQIWFVEGNGRLSGGAEAANRVMRGVWWARPLTYLYRLPGFRQLEEWLYRWIATNRHRLPGGTAVCEVGKRPY